MTLYDKDGESNPDKWIMFKDEIKKHPKTKVQTFNPSTNGIYMKLTTETRCQMQILKTKLNCHSWQEFANKILEELK